MQRQVKWPGPNGANAQFFDHNLMRGSSEMGLGNTPMCVGVQSPSMFPSGLNYGGNAQNNAGFGDMSELHGIFPGRELSRQMSRQSSDMSGGTTCDMGSPDGSPSGMSCLPTSIGGNPVQPSAIGGNCLPQRLYDTLLRIFPYCQNEVAMDGFKELLQVLLTHFDVGPSKSQVDVNYWFKGEDIIKGILVPVKEGAMSLDPAVLLRAVVSDGNLLRNQWSFRNMAVNGSYYMLTETSPPLIIPDSKTIYIMVEEDHRAMSPAASLTEEFVASANADFNKNDSGRLNDYSRLLNISITGNISGSQEGSGLSGSQSPVGSFSDGASPDDFFTSEEGAFGGSFGRSLHEVLGHSGEQEWIGGQTADPRLPARTTQLPEQPENNVQLACNVGNPNVVNEVLNGGGVSQSLNATHAWIKQATMVKPVLTGMAASGSAAPKEEWDKLNLFHKLCNLGQSVPDVRMGVDISIVPWKLTEFREGQTKLHGRLRWKKKGKYWERDMTVKDDNRDRGKWSMHSASREWIQEVEPGRSCNIIKRYFKWMPKPEGGLFSDWTWILHEYVSVDATKKYTVYEEPTPSGPNFTGLFVLTCTRAVVKEPPSEGGRKLAGGGDDSGNGRHMKKKKHSNDHHGGGGEAGGDGKGFGGGFGGGYQGGNQRHDFGNHKSMRMALEAVLARIGALTVSDEGLAEDMLASAKESTSEMSAEEATGGIWESESDEEDLAESDVESTVDEEGFAPKAASSSRPIWHGAFGSKEDTVVGEGKKNTTHTSEEDLEQQQRQRADRVVTELQVQPETSLLKMFLGGEENQATSSKMDDVSLESSAQALEVREFSLAELEDLIGGLECKEEALDEYFRSTKGNSNGALLNVKQLRVRCEKTAFAKIVKSQSLLNHPNLARIVGYCAEENNQSLIYSICGSVSLHDRLHPADDTEVSPLSWEERLRICFAAASAVDFLHNNCQPSLVHGDMSSRAVLVDQNNGAQVINCLVPGLVAASGKNFQASDEFMNAKEYYQSVQGSEQNASRRTKGSDVYALGVIFLELLSGRHPYDSTREQAEMRLVEWAKSCVAADKVEKFLDPAMISLEGPLRGIKLSRARMLADIATRCTHRDRMERPAIEEVLKNLASFQTHAEV
eukprot:TRINITY_DN4734_c0_g1_i1.p1 TRINITY_DN4734_c0_g1~~TRINITY_DN4734_c0_g1_i1.p1  ORF type:complete len:1126 (-),score=285.15 TRINITY_DN4734_c0_g1_i1:574-3951(-)